MSGRRIYLDNSATSFPKPPRVYEAMLDYATRLGASPGRGHYVESREGARLIRQCRERICRYIQGESPDHVIFTLNTSDALNLAIKGVVRARRLARQSPKGRIHLVTTDLDHNSVLRPFVALEADGDVDVTRVACDPATGRVAPSAICHALRPDTALVAVVHASNVGGTLQPVEQIGTLCREKGVAFLVDVAQSLGHVPVDARAMHADLLAFPGHKGLLGPQGTGALYIRPGFEDRLATTREGGTGSIAEYDEQPARMPERYEAGSHNTMGIVGLSEGVQWLLERGEHAYAHERDLVRAMLVGLRQGGCRMSDSESGVDGPLSCYRLLGPTIPDERIGVFSLTHDALSPAEMAMLLEQQFGLLVRAGIHCAPRAHATFGTLASSPEAASRGEPQGAFRISFGPFNTREDVRASLDALASVAARSRVEA